MSKYKRARLKKSEWWILNALNLVGCTTTTYQQQLLQQNTKKMTKKTTKKKMKKTTKKKIGSNSSQITCGRLTSPLKGEVQPELAHTLRIRLNSCIFINIRMQHGHQTLCFDLLDMFLILYPGSVVTGNTPHHPHSRIKSRMLWFLFAVHNSRQTER